MIWLTYAGIASVIYLIHRNGANFRDLERIHRASWSGAWLIVCAAFLMGFSGHERPPPPSPDWGLGLLGYVWSAVFLCLGGGGKKAFFLLIALTLIGIVFVPTETGPLAATGAAGLFYSVATHHSMTSRRAILFRTLNYWTCFISTFGFLLPWSIARATRETIDIGGSRAWPASIAIFSVGFLLAVCSTHEFLKAQGTPEPTDPPPRLCTKGIYGRIRHPIQIAECCFIASGSLLIGGPVVYLYAAVFCAALVTIARHLEEKKLAELYGEPFVRYKKDVPAFLPFTRMKPPTRRAR